MEKLVAYSEGDKSFADDGHIKMDFSLETPEERKLKVDEIIANTPPERLTPYYLEKLTDYMLFAVGKQEKKVKKKDRTIVSKNVMKTVEKREMSFEGLAGKLENGEDGIYNMITNDKNILFSPKRTITKEDVENIPGLAELLQEIEKVKEECKIATGRKAFLLRKQLIQMYQDQYVFKDTYKKPMHIANITKSLPKINLDELIGLDENDEVSSTGLINFYNPKHVSTVLCNYSKIKEDCQDKFDSDIKWFMEDLDALIDRTLEKDYPLYYDLLIYKIDGKSNAEIQELLYNDYGVKHSVEYLSSLQRNKIPKMISDKAAEEWLYWYFQKEEPKKMKKCTKCGQLKPAHNRFFSKNSTSKDGWYSICKNCRNRKK